MHSLDPRVALLGTGLFKNGSCLVLNTPEHGIFVCLFVVNFYRGCNGVFQNRSSLCPIYLHHFYTWERLHDSAGGVGAVSANGRYVNSNFTFGLLCVILESISAAIARGIKLSIANRAQGSKWTASCSGAQVLPSQ